MLVNSFNYIFIPESCSVFHYMSCLLEDSKCSLDIISRWFMPFCEQLCLFISRNRVCLHKCRIIGVYPITMVVTGFIRMFVHREWHIKCFVGPKVVEKERLAKNINVVVKLHNSKNECHIHKSWDATASSICFSVFIAKYFFIFISFLTIMINQY